jgi:H+/Cl- antiporter ClcA
MNVTIIVWKKMLLLVLPFVVVFFVVAAWLVPSTIFAGHGVPNITAAFSDNGNIMPS